MRALLSGEGLERDVVGIGGRVELGQGPRLYGRRVVHWDEAKALVADGVRVGLVGLADAEPPAFAQFAAAVGAVAAAAADARPPAARAAFEPVLVVLVVEAADAVTLHRNLLGAMEMGRGRSRMGA
jgi:hypothetical protein